MKSHILTGSRSEIAESIARIDGEIREVIVYVEESADLVAPPAETVEDMFAEMEPHMVKADYVDDSREAIYTRMKGE